MRTNICAAAYAADPSEGSGAFQIRVWWATGRIAEVAVLKGSFASPRGGFGTGKKVTCVAEAVSKDWTVPLPLLVRMFSSSSLLVHPWLLVMRRCDDATMRRCDDATMRRCVLCRERAIDCRLRVAVEQCRNSYHRPPLFARVVRVFAARSGHVSARVACVVLRRSRGAGIKQVQPITARVGAK